MTRFVPVTVLVVMLAASRIAGAQAMLPNGTQVNFDKLYIHENGSMDAVQPMVEPDSEWKYFNYAHCQCGKVQPGFVESTYEYLVVATGSTAPIAEPLNIWVGASCNTDATTRNTMCHAINQAPMISTIQAASNVHVAIPIYDAMNPEPIPAGGSPKDCQQRILSATVWGLADATPGSGLLDFSTTKSINTDAQPPPLPTNFHASGGDGAIEISWTVGSDTSDVFGYQALCARADDDSPGKTSGRPGQRYMTTKTLCNVDQTILPDAGVTISVPAGSPDTGSTVTLSDDLKQLNPDFLCGESISPSANSLRIEGLENGTAYKVVLLAVDKYQNVTGTWFASTLTPVPSTDFWEDLHNRGSKAEGGLCLLAETYGDDSSLTGALRAFRDDALSTSRAGRGLIRAYYASLGKLGGYVHGSLALRAVAGVVLAPAVAIALLWHWLGLIGLLTLLGVVLLWCTRRAWRPRLARAGLGPQWATRLVRLALATAVAMVVVLASGPAHAGGNQPYWEDADQITDNKASDEPGQVNWRVGFRIGPYTPAIDDQIGGPKPGPFEQMFGKQQHMLVMLDVDRVLWSGFGQLGVGLTLGYWQKTARAFAMDSSQTDSERARAADRNAFRLIPTALSAVYRFTWLDDEYGVPVVPYARAGLAYYLWWITVANGDFAKICGNDGMNCGNKAYGASLGVQGSLGLSIRAERIDASAAMSMRQSGIEHAGIYGELSVAKVDGFGSDKKLSVGDATWFAGVEFEF